MLWTRIQIDHTSPHIIVWFIEYLIAKKKKKKLNDGLVSNYVCVGYVTRKNNGFFFHFTFQRIRVFSAASVVVVVVENLWLKYLYWKINKYTHTQTVCVCVCVLSSRDRVQTQRCTCWCTTTKKKEKRTFFKPNKTIRFLTYMKTFSQRKKNSLPNNNQCIMSENKYHPSWV